MQEYTTKSMAPLFDVNENGMRTIIATFRADFPAPSPRIPRGGKMVTNFYPAPAIEALLIRFRGARQGNESPMNTFRRLFNRPSKRGQTSSLKAGSLAELHVKVDLILERLAAR